MEIKNQMNKYIYVTEDDINNGKICNVTLCPIALSLRRHLHLFLCPNGHPPSEVQVRTTNVELKYGNCPTDKYDFHRICNDRLYIHYRLSKFVSTQIQVFDLNGKIKPFKFKVLD